MRQRPMHSPLLRVYGSTVMPSADFYADPFERDRGSTLKTQIERGRK